MGKTSCALARVKLVDAVEALRKSTGGEKLATGIKAGYVTSIVTPLRAVTGNASWGSFLQLARHPLAAAIDVVESTGKSARTGFKIPPHKFREYANALDADGMAAFGRGFGRGTRPVREAFATAKSSDNKPVSTFVNELRLRLNARPEIPNTTVEYKRVNYDSPLAQTMTDASFSILEAADRPWWLAAFDTEIYRQSKLLGIQEGLTGAELKKRSAEHMAAPSDEMILRAQDAANYATFKDKNILSDLATGGKQSIKRYAEADIDPALSPAAQAVQRSKRSGAAVGNVVAEATVPFTGVPSSVAGKIASTSPFGLLNPDIYQTGPGAQALRAKALANVGLGFGMVAAGMVLADRGLISGGLPRNAAERAQWNEAGKQPFSILIGGKWIGLRILGPAASSLFMGAAMRRAEDENPDDKAAAIGKGVGASAEFLTQQTYLQQIGNLIETAKGGSSVPRLVGSMLPTPAFLGQAGRALDPYERSPNGLVETARGKVGLGFMNPRRLGPTGPLPRRTIAERVSSVAWPLPIKQSRDTPVLAEIRRLKVSFGLPSRSMKVNGENRKLTNDDYEKFVSSVGPMTMQMITDMLADPGFRALDDDTKRDELEKIVTKVRAAGRDEVKARLQSGK